LIIITIIASLIGRFNEIELVQKALDGVNISVAVLLLSSLIKFAKKTISGLLPGLICAASFIVVGFLGFSPITVVFASAGLGILGYVLPGGEK
jgi:chromate transport protein ChrA